MSKKEFIEDDDPVRRKKLIAKLEAEEYERETAEIARREYAKAKREASIEKAKSDAVRRVKEGGLLQRGLKAIVAQADTLSRPRTKTVRKVMAKAKTKTVRKVMAKAKSRKKNKYMVASRPGIFDIKI